MDYTFAATIGLHTLAAVVWVGGMFFAHMVLRPSVTEMTASLRLALWRRVLPRFFRWVALSIAVLLLTGYGVLLTGYRGGISGGNVHIDSMQITGWIMIVLFIGVILGPFQAFKRCLETNDLVGAAKWQGRIRAVIVVNLVLGLFTTFIGAAGTFVGY
ncbi:MAG TPA: hypothetical protein VL974_13120 [Magnetospirillum sp.]|jgi:uncharacterized membrane protein|nr:hypothetical protein [Magnetospirillum sp.]